MEKTLRCFFAAAFVAAFLGACGPNPGTDSGPMPMEDGGMPPDDTGTPPPPDGGVDTGTDGGMGAACMYDMLAPGCGSCECDMSYVDTFACMDAPDMCTAPAGMNSCETDGTNRCGFNIPAEAMPYSDSEFVCADRIDNDTWVDDGGTTGVSTEIHNGQILLTSFRAVVYNPLFPGAPAGFTCGNMGRCWLNWANPDSTHARCLVQFWTDGSYTTPATSASSCMTATVDCFPAGTSIADAEAGIGMVRSTAAWVMDGI